MFYFRFEPPSFTDFDDAEFVRVGCDLMNFFFVYDEYTDVSDEPTTRKIANIVLSGMNDPSAQPTAENHVLGRMINE